MESIPDSGVEIRKAVVAPLFAPCFLSDAAAGSTPHDQSGRGTPSKAALKTELKRPKPRWRMMKLVLRNTFSNPAMRIPMSMYNEESSSMFHPSCTILRMISIMV